MVRPRCGSRDNLRATLDRTNQRRNRYEDPEIWKVPFDQPRSRDDRSASQASGHAERGAPESRRRLPKPRSHLPARRWLGLGARVFGKAFAVVAKDAEIGHVRLHDLRHACASLVLKNGVHAKVVSERLGHSTISITLDTYSHVLPGLQEAAADKLDDLLKWPAAFEATNG